MVTENITLNNSTDKPIEGEPLEIRLVHDAARMIRLGELRFAGDVLEVLSQTLEFAARGAGILNTSGQLNSTPEIVAAIDRLARAANTVNSASVMVDAVAGEGRVQTPEGARSLADQVDTVGDILEIAIESFKGVKLEIRDGAPVE